MIQDDDGELVHVKLDPSLVNSDTAIIVLDEYDDICWVWIGRNVNMPTRMHALRMSKSVQKSGYHIGTTTIGMATSKLIEMMEKNDSDATVAAHIVSFKQVLDSKWSFDDEVLAYDSKRAQSYEATSPTIMDTPRAPEISVPPTISTAPAPRPATVEIEARTVEPTPAPPRVARDASLAEQKTAFLLYSVVKYADLVYTEKIQRDGKSGIKIEAPAIVMLEAITDSNDIIIAPANFGDSDIARKIKSEYDSWVRKL
ncbi:MAG: hypothetical protein ACTSUB_07965 [Candidatus Thorarchaeota archaeon]